MKKIRNRKRIKKVYGEIEYCGCDYCEGHSDFLGYNHDNCKELIKEEPKIIKPRFRNSEFVAKRKYGYEVYNCPNHGEVKVRRLFMSLAYSREVIWKQLNQESLWWSAIPKYPWGKSGRREIPEPLVYKEEPCGMSFEEYKEKYLGDLI